MDLTRRSFLGMTLGVAAAAALPPLVCTAALKAPEPDLTFEGFMHLDTGEVLPFGPIEMHEDRWRSEPYEAVEKFLVTHWSLYRHGRLVVDKRPRVCPVTLYPGDSITLDLYGNPLAASA